MNEAHSKHIDSHVERGVLVVTITAAQLHNDAVADALGHELILAVVHAKTQQVVLDLGQVKALASVGIRPLLGFHRYLKEVGGRLVVCGLTKPVLDVLKASRLVGAAGDSIAIFETQPDAAAAVATLAADREA